MVIIYTTTTLDESSTVTMVHTSLEAVADVFIDNFGEDGAMYHCPPTPEGINNLVQQIQEANPSAILLWDEHEIEVE